MKALEKPRVTFDMTAKIAGISTTMALHIFDTHVGIKRSPFSQIFCIDEIYAVKDQQKVYACVLVGFMTRQTYNLLSDRKNFIWQNISLILTATLV
ncbi:MULTISPECIES: hypothetical protein [Clostridia]|nr:MULTISPECIES: hypothetical protein [Clostridia]